MYRLTTQDWWWIGGFLVVALGLAIYHSRSALRSVDEYFVGGQRVPWWILGTSIVATSFAADTPLAIAGLVITDGIAGNWFWWAIVPSGMLGVFLFAGPWRRSGCTTQAEFTILRYGAEAAPLRVTYVLYFGLLRNALTLGWVNLAMLKIISACSGGELTSNQTWAALGACFAVTVVYTLLGGITGVMWTDFMQFLLALSCSMALAWYGVQGAGGLERLVEVATAAVPRGTTGATTLAFFAPWGTTALWACAIYLSIFWVACTPTDCNGYAVQRLLSARDERHAVWGYLWYNIAHYVLRTWPWILVGLVALALFDYGHGDHDPEQAYMEVLLGHAPTWLVGPVLASLLAAYMSTIDTHVNWGASFVINDLYRPYVAPGRSERHYMRASHAATVGVAAVGVGVTLCFDSIKDAWGLFFALTSGMGVVGIARWLWWRVTAWTEIGCMAGALTCTAVMLVLERTLSAPYHAAWGWLFKTPFNFLVIVPGALVAAAVATRCSRPAPRPVLDAFVQRVRPPGPGWNTIGGRGRRPGEAFMPQSSLRRAVACWLLATLAVYAAMFGIGWLLLRGTAGAAALIGAAVSLGYLAGTLHRPDGPATDPRGGHDRPGPPG